MPTSYTIGAHFEKLIAEHLKGGRYSSASEIVREGLRLFETREMVRQAQLEALREEIQKGIDSGPGIPLEEAAEILRKKYRERAGLS